MLYKTPEKPSQLRTAVSITAVRTGSVSFVWNSLSYFNVKQTISGKS
jgi:hypothetical protein